MEKNNVKSLSEYKQEKPQQLTLFEMNSVEKEKYSNTVDLYDFIPKYHWGNVARLRVNDQFLPRIEREFECKGVNYKVSIDPAKLKNKAGKVQDYYLSKREELVEDALRKLACEGHGIFLDDQSGVVFSIYQLQQELQKRGHGYKKSEIKDALLICAGTSIEVRTEDGTGIFKSHIFESLGLKTDENNTKAFVRFNPLVTASIRNKSFRQINYEKSMSYKSAIARQLFKRMSHHYRQASLMNTYQIKLSTIIRDIGLTTYQRLPNNLREVTEAFEEMKTKEVVLKFEIQKTLDLKNRNKLVDAKFVITPHPKFCAEVIRANEKQKSVQNMQKS
jgi:hypothetical protein